ncbi:MAG: hypothetical protein ABSB15_27280 [Bryobacteraceae bacterium]
MDAHRADASGQAFFAEPSRNRITVAAFLNFFIAWESFLENTIVELMTGGATVSGSSPTKFIAPVDASSARGLIIGINRYFDYGNHDNVRKMVRMYFRDGYPYEPHLSSIASDLADLRTLRNSSAHITSTTQTALEGLAQRILSRPWPDVNLYSLLTAADPRATTGETVYSSYKNRLIVAAELIVTG